MGKTALRALASIGAGGLSAIVIAGIVAATHMNPASVAGVAVVTFVGSMSTAVIALAVAKSGPAPTAPTASMDSGRR